MSGYTQAGHASISHSLLIGIIGLHAILLPRALIAQSTTAAAAADSGQLEEVVVTAQRREENQQSVPISITAITGNQLKIQGIEDTRTLSQTVPALDFTQQNNGALIYLRGVGSANAGMGQETDVAVYLDGVYIATPLSDLFSFNNIDRVEVLKGPQGTLFGRNAVGGVVQIVTKDPTRTPTFDASIGYGNYDTTEGSLYASTGVGENLAADIAVYSHDQINGWGHNLVLNTPSFADQEDNSVRTKWLWTPTSTTTVRFSADYGRSQTGSGVSWSIFPGTVGIDGATRNLGFYNVTQNYPSASVVTQGGIAININQNLGWASLVSITADRQVRGEFTLDEDATSLNLVDALINQRDSTFSQEFQLVSPQTGPVRWIGGLYYSSDKPQFDPFYATGGAFAAHGGYENIVSSQYTNSYAAFGQTTVDVGDSTHATAGVRYTKDERQLLGTQIFGVSTVAADVSEHANFDKATYRFSLDHQFTPDVMIYASYNRGFKSGTFNLSDLTQPVVQPETLDAYEIGAKSEMLDRRLRLNSSAFYYDYKNIQLSEVLPVGGQQIINAPGAKIYGFDFDFNALLLSNFTVRGSFGYTHGRYESFNGATVPYYTAKPTGGAAETLIDAGGNDTIHTPPVTADLSATYTQVTQLGTFDLTATYSYMDSFYWYPDNVTQQPAYSLVSTALVWKSMNERYRATLWGKNLTDAHYYSFVSESTLGFAGSPAPPRTFGITLGVHF